MGGGLAIILKCFGIGMISQVLQTVFDSVGKKDMGHIIIMLGGTAIFYIAVSEIYTLITTVATMFKIPM